MSGADANAALGHYQKVISYLIGVLLKNGCSHAHTVGRAFIMQPEEYDTPVRLAAAKNVFAKILVIGQQDSAFTCGSRQDVLVVGLRHCLRNGQHIVAGAAQVFNYRRAGGLVNNEPHGWRLHGDAEGENGFVGQHPGCISQGSADVLRL